LLSHLAVAPDFGNYLVMVVLHEGVRGNAAVNARFRQEFSDLVNGNRRAKIDARKAEPPKDRQQVLHSAVRMLVALVTRVRRESAEHLFEDRITERLVHVLVEHTAVVVEKGKAV